MIDDKGNFYIIDAVLAVMILLMVMFVVNTIISIPDPIYSDELNDFKNSQDIMEVLSGKINFTDRTFIGDISNVLIEGKNSKNAIREVSKLSKDKFKTLGVNNFRFSETNVLGNEILADSGDFNSASNVSIASRSYGDYSYTLYLW